MEYTKECQHTVILYVSKSKRYEILNSGWAHVQAGSAPLKKA